MNMFRIAHYHFLAYRKEQLWLPAGLWGLFAILAIGLQEQGSSDGIAKAFLGMILPLMAAILSASAVLDDPAIELQLAAPRRPWRILLERLAALLCIVAVGAFSYQLLMAGVGVEIDYPYGPVGLQMAWLVPSLAFMGFSSLVAMGFTAATPATLLVGIVWLMQALIGGHFANNDWARYLYLFMAARRPEHPQLQANLLCLVVLGSLFLLLAARLLEREEPYL